MDFCKRTGLLFVWLVVFIFLVTFVSSESIQQRLDGQVGQEYIISQPCATCTYINITVFTKDGMILSNVPMSDNGSTWIYTFTPNTSLRHDVNAIGDINGQDDSFGYWFDVTLSGEQMSTEIIMADIFLILLILGLIYFMYRKHSGTDFDKATKRVAEQHNGDVGKTFVKGLWLGLMKNSFLWFYLMGWLMLFVLKDIVLRFNSQEIYNYMILFFDIYSFGFILIIAIFAGIVYRHFQFIIELIEDINLGVNA